MTDRPNLSKSKPAAATSNTPQDKPRPPRFVAIAAVALLLSGLAGLLGAGANYLDSVKGPLRDNARDSTADSMLDKFDEVKKAGPSGGNRAADLAALQSQIRNVKGASASSFDAFAVSIKNDVAKLKPGASKDGQKALDDLNDQAKNIGTLNTQVSNYQRATLISSVVVVIALALAAAAAYRGRYWARWTTLGVWVLATFTGALAGVGSVLNVAANIPMLLKIPSFVSGLALVVAVVMVNLRPSVAFFNLGRPDRGNRPQRRGLFSPAASRTAAATPAATKPAGSAGPDRARTKARSSEAAVAKGAELARTRAKASKSRRSGV